MYRKNAVALRVDKHCVEYVLTSLQRAGVPNVWHIGAFDKHTGARLDMTGSMECLIKATYLYLEKGWINGWDSTEQPSFEATALIDMRDRPSYLGAAQPLGAELERRFKVKCEDLGKAVADLVQWRDKAGVYLQRVTELSSEAKAAEGREIYWRDEHRKLGESLARERNLRRATEARLNLNIRALEAELDELEKYRDAAIAMAEAGCNRPVMVEDSYSSILSVREHLKGKCRCRGRA